MPKVKISSFCGLSTDAFTHRRFYTQTLSHKNPFTHRSSYTQKLLYTQTPLHTDTFTHRHVYTQTLLHTDAFTHRHFYTRAHFHTETFTHRSFWRVWLNDIYGLELKLFCFFTSSTWWHRALLQTFADILLVKCCHMCDLQHHGTDLFGPLMCDFP